MFTPILALLFGVLWDLILRLEEKVFLWVFRLTERLIEGLEKET